jgi:hypothetical protein
MSRVPGVDALRPPPETGIMKRGFTYTVTPTVSRSLVEMWLREMCWKALLPLFENVGVDGVNAVRKHVVRRVEAGGGATLL